MKYNIYKKQHNSGVEDLVIEIDNNQHALELFLISTITTESIGKWILEGIEQVLSGKEESVKRNGELYGVSIGKDRTEAFNVIDLSENIESSIPTTEFKEIVEAWTKAITEFNNSK